MFGLAYFGTYSSTALLRGGIRRSGVREEAVGVQDARPSFGLSSAHRKLKKVEDAVASQGHCWSAEVSIVEAGEAN